MELRSKKEGCSQAHYLPHFLTESTYLWLVSLLIYATRCLKQAALVNVRGYKNGSKIYFTDQHILGIEVFWGDQAQPNLTQYQMSI